VLVDVQSHSAAIAGGTGEQSGGLDGDVRPVCRHPGEFHGSADAHGEIVGGRRAHVFVEGDRLVGDGDVVVPVVEQSADLEEDVDLARCACVHHG
jgi:hypothetical protein